MNIKPRFFLLLCLALVICSCTSSGGGDDDDSDTIDDDPVADEGPLLSLKCGLVIDGLLQSEFSLTQGEEILGISINDPKSAVIDLPNGEQLVQFFGIGSVGQSPNRSLEVLQSLTQEKLYLFRPTPSCPVTFEGGGLGEKVTIVTASGKSFTEEILRAGFTGSVDGAGSCGESLVASCLEDIRQRNLDKLPKSAGEFSEFLWKPESESDYNPGGLSILFNPCAASITVNGQPIVDYGGTNGRCVTARSAKSGCSFGTNIVVEAFNEEGVPFTRNGEPFVTIPSGCDRFEF